MYSNTKIIPLKDLKSMDLYYLNMAIQVAEESRFESSHRVGACLVERKDRLHR